MMEIYDLYIEKKILRVEIYVLSFFCSLDVVG